MPKQINKINIKPADKIKLFDPVRGDFIPIEGRTVIKNQYWGRRILEKSAVVFKAKKQTKNNQIK